MPMAHFSTVRERCERTSCSVSLGSTRSVSGWFSCLVSLMNCIAFTRFMSFSLMSVEYLANFTRSAVVKSSLSSAIMVLSSACCRRSIISDEVISIALKPNRSSMYLRRVSVRRV